MILKNAKNLSNIGLKAKNAAVGVKGTARNAAAGVKGVAKNTAAGIKNSGAGKFVEEKVQPKKLFIDAKDRDGKPKERLDNLYTGKRANPWVVGTVGAGLMGVNFAKDGWNHHVFGQLEKATNYDVQEYGAPDVMMYDGVGQERAPKNLNANGSLVFGLHNMRKG